MKDPETWDKVKDAWNLMATGTKSLTEIATIMNDWGLTETHGKKIYKLRPQTVNRIFRLKFYMGILTSSKYPDEVRGQHVPMITEEQFYKVQAIIDGRNPNKLALSKRNFANPEFPLRRVIKCAHCGWGLTGSRSKGRNARYSYYRCSGKCNNSSTRVDLLENSLIQELKAITPSEKCLNLFMHFIYKCFHERNLRLQTIKNNADNEIARLQSLRRALIEKNLSGVYSDEIFKEQNAMVEDQIMKAQISKDDSTFDKYNIDQVMTFMKTLLADLGETYRRSNLSQVKGLIGSMFPSGITWDHKGTWEYKISPIYQCIRGFENNPIRSGAGDGSRTHHILLGKETF